MSNPSFQQCLVFGECSQRGGGGGARDSNSAGIATTPRNGRSEMPSNFTRAGILARNSRFTVPRTMRAGQYSWRHKSCNLNYHDIHQLYINQSYVGVRRHGVKVVTENLGPKNWGDVAQARNQKFFKGPRKTKGPTCSNQGWHLFRFSNMIGCMGPK